MANGVTLQDLLRALRKEWQGASTSPVIENLPNDLQNIGPASGPQIENLPNVAGPGNVPQQPPDLMLPPQLQQILAQAGLGTGTGPGGPANPGFTPGFVGGGGGGEGGGIGQRLLGALSQGAPLALAGALGGMDAAGAYGRIMREDRQVKEQREFQERQAAQQRALQILLEERRGQRQSAEAKEQREFQERQSAIARNFEEDLLRIQNQYDIDGDNRRYRNQLRALKEEIKLKKKSPEELDEEDRRALARVEKELELRFKNAEKMVGAGLAPDYSQKERGSEVSPELVSQNIHRAMQMARSVMDGWVNDMSQQVDPSRVPEELRNLNPTEQFEALWRSIYEDFDQLTSQRTGEGFVKGRKPSGRKPGAGLTHSLMASSHSLGGGQSEAQGDKAIIEGTLAPAAQDPEIADARSMIEDEPLADPVPLSQRILPEGSKIAESQRPVHRAIRGLIDAAPAVSEASRPSNVSQALAEILRNEAKNRGTPQERVAASRASGANRMGPNLVVDVPNFEAVGSQLADIFEDVRSTGKQELADFREERTIEGVQFNSPVDLQKVINSVSAAPEEFARQIGAEVDTVRAAIYLLRSGVGAGVDKARANLAKFRDGEEIKKVRVLYGKAEINRLAETVNQIIENYRMLKSLERREQGLDYEPLLEGVSGGGSGPSRPVPKLNRKPRRQ